MDNLLLDFGCAAAQLTQSAGSVVVVGFGGVAGAAAGNIGGDDGGSAADVADPALTAGPGNAAAASAHDALAALVVQCWGHTRRAVL